MAATTPPPPPKKTKAKAPPKATEIPLPESKGENEEDSETDRDPDDASSSSASDDDEDSRDGSPLPAGSPRVVRKGGRRRKWKRTRPPPPPSKKPRKHPAPRLTGTPPRVNRPGKKGGDLPALAPPKSGGTSMKRGKKAAAQRPTTSFFVHSGPPQFKTYRKKNIDREPRRVFRHQQDINIAHPPLMLGDRKDEVLRSLEWVEMWSFGWSRG